MTEPKYYVITKGTNEDMVFIKSWFSDETILFISEDQAKEFIQEFPMFFEGIEYNILPVQTHNYEPDEYDILYSDFIKEEKFLEEKKNLKPKYAIKNSDGKMAGMFDRIIVFDNQNEITNFMVAAPEFFNHSEYEIIEVYTDLAWEFYTDIKSILTNFEVYEKEYITS